MPRHLITAALIFLLLPGCASMRADSHEESMAAARRAFLAERYDQALPLLRSAAEAGNARAQYAVGYMLYNALGVEAAPEQALRWIRRAAANGDPLAVEALGRVAQGLSRAELQPDPPQPGGPAQPGTGTTGDR